MSHLPSGFSESTSTFRLTGTTLFGQVVLGHEQGALSAGNPSEMASAVFASWVNASLGWLDSEWTLDQVDVRANVGGAILSGASGQAPVAGGALGGPASTPAVAVLIRKLTNQGGRHGRGRMYLPGLQEAWTTESGALAGAGQSAVILFASQFLDELDSAEMPMRLLHVDETLDPAIVTFLSVQSIVATQRRRQRR
jgi:hypothetical protein